MSTHSVPPNPSDHLATFRTRGVAVPVTTPRLAGTRVRQSARGGIEFIVPNPSGARGVYIVPLSGIASICPPTVHDTLLFRLLSGLQAVNPATVRRASLKIAQDGHAGRSAALAAERLADADRAQRQRTHAMLLAALADPAARGVARDRQADAALDRIAPALGRTPSQLAAGLRVLADAFAPIGFPGNDAEARIPGLIRRLQQTCTELTGWIDRTPANDVGGLGRAVAVPMQMGWETGEIVVQHTRTALDDPLALLRRWAADPPSVLAFAARCDWLLDGWDQLCLVWLSAETDSARRAALLELPQLVPVLPREAAGLPDLKIPAEATWQACRVISREDGWRSGAAAHALIERNEVLRARGL